AFGSVTGKRRKAFSRCCNDSDKATGGPEQHEEDPAFMERLMIRGGRPLRGTVGISGAKNSAIALIPAAILAESEVRLDNLPQLTDVAVYAELLEELGCKVDWTEDAMSIDPSSIRSVPMPNG